MPPFDPEGAKKLLEEAKADGVPVDTPIELIGRTNNYPNATEVNEAIQAMLQDVGFTVNLRMLEVAEQEKLYSKPYLEGRGLPRGSAPAAVWLDLACTHGDGPACRVLAGLVATGAGVAKDEAKAKALMEQACKQGDPSACTGGSAAPPK